MNLPAQSNNYIVSDDFIITMQECYPEINIKRELMKMRAWLVSNPARRKTPKGMKRFINSWLSRATPDTDKTFIEQHTDRSWAEGT